MPQHFLLSAKAVTLSLFDLTDLSEEKAYELFKAIRFADNAGVPYCPTEACDRAPCYEITSGTRKLFKCKACEKQFTVTSQTVFASHKLSFKRILIVIKLFVDGVNGESASMLRRFVGLSYKTAFVLAHKLREAMAELQNDRPLTGKVVIDGLFFGGKVRKENLVEDRKDQREFNDKRRAIVTLKERRLGGRSRSFVVRNEKYALPIIKQLIHPSADLITDDGTSWGKLFLAFNDHEIVPHSVGFIVNGIHINDVESFHSRIRRGERGIYLHISGAHAQNYADEFSWREDHRRVSNGEQFKLVLGRAARMRQATKWTGYWNRRKREPAPVDQCA